MTAFVSGLELSRQFYHRLVRPILHAEFPGLRHGAALPGRGSEVLGFDDEMSTDHDWNRGCFSSCGRMTWLVTATTSKGPCGEGCRRGFRNRAGHHEITRCVATSWSSWLLTWTA